MNGLKITAHKLLCLPLKSSGQKKLDAHLKKSKEVQKPPWRTTSWLSWTELRTSLSVSELISLLSSVSRSLLSSPLMCTKEMSSKCLLTRESLIPNHLPGNPNLNSTGNKNQLKRTRRPVFLVSAIGTPSTIMSMSVTVDVWSLLHLLIDAISPLHKPWTWLWVVHLLVQLVQVKQKQLRTWEELLVYRLWSLTVLIRWTINLWLKFSWDCPKQVHGVASMSSTVSQLKCYQSSQLKSNTASTHSRKWKWTQPAICSSSKTKKFS